MTNQELWRSALGELELLISKANFTTWFKSTSIASFENGRVIVSVPNAFTKAWLENKYHTFIMKALQNISGNTIKDISYQVELVTVEAVDKPASIKITSPSESVMSFGLNPRYTFSTFIVGKSNELARAAALAVADNPGQVYNPLFLYGGVGLGKTHLMQAIGHEIIKKFPGKKVIYVPCEKFTTEFIQAIGSGKMEKFKATYRSVDVLLVDDIQFLSGKEGTQEEFFHTFNTLHQANKQIVISSDRPPKAIHSLENRLISRFEWGMIADIASPDLETRTAILELKCQERNYRLDREIINYLANTVQNNIRELEGALNRIIAYHQLNNQPPTLVLVQELMVNLHSTNKYGANLTSKKILNIVAQYYDITMEDLVGISRKKNLVVPRQVSMYLMREELKSSFPTIGNELGGRDHTTAMHACNKIQVVLKDDNKIQQDIHNLKQQLANT
ncbi:MAG: Chromosomal replication initiator protein DnaA [Parcubacteria group bacterium GW2011_GWE2_43_12]|nr:MAG: Chromosomal replication initiator protein DnaA [Parcubacteria group bacterium GW2011_GWE2_43_12]